MCVNNNNYILCIFYNFSAGNDGKIENFNRF